MLLAGLKIRIPSQIVNRTRMALNNGLEAEELGFDYLSLMDAKVLLICDHGWREFFASQVLDKVISSRTNR